MRKNTTKRISSFILALVLCFSFSTYAFAAEVSTSADDVVTGEDLHIIGEYTFEVTEDGIMPYSSVGGYNQKAITADDRTLVIECSGSGMGGMGITIETTCSQGAFSIDYAGASYIGDASTITGTMKTQDHLELHNLWQSNLQEYYLFFTIPSHISSYFVKVWIYG